MYRKRERQFPPIAALRHHGDADPGLLQPTKAKEDDFHDVLISLDYHGNC